MASEVFNLAILLSLKDAASGGLDRFSSKLRAAGKDGKQFTETLEDIREEMNKGLAVGGIGAAGLGLMYQGVKVAANYQSAVTDLRGSFAQVGKDGKVNLDALGKDMVRAEAIAVRLGNALPGTTEDFVQMMQVLKQNGLEAETIFNGAAEAVANLAVANGDLPKNVAKDFAQFGQLFKLKPEEYVKAADTFSRLFTSSGIGSSELIEALKYFQGRSGAALGISGLEDAEKTVRVLGLLRKQGLEGSIAGTAFNNLFSGYISARNKKDDPLEKLKKLEGIDIKLFDGKGKFAGIDNLFRQLEPLQKLTEEKRVSYLKEIFGEEGMSAAVAILKTGAEGWKQYNAEQEKTISLQQKNADKAQDFNNQMEALSGSVKNLVVTGFSPLLPQLTSAINSTNAFVGSVQEFGRENPNLVKTLSTLALYGSTALVVVGGIKAMTSAWRIFTLASSVSKGGGILQYLQQTSVAANTTSNSVTTATSKMKGLRGAWQGLSNSSVVKLGVDTAAIVGAEIVITGFVKMWSEAAEKTEKMAANARIIRQQYDGLMGNFELYNKVGDYGKNDQLKQKYDVLARQFLETINRGGDLQQALHPEKATWWQTISNPFPYGMKADQSQFSGAQFSPEVAAKMWREAGITMPLQDPNVLARLLMQIQQGGGDLNLNQGDIKLLIEALEKIAGKEDMKTAQEILRREGIGTTPQPQTKSLYDLFYKPASSGFPSLNNQFQNPLLNNKKPIFEQKPLIDLNRSNQIPTNFLTSIEQLNQPLGFTTQAFTSLSTNSKSWQESMMMVVNNQKAAFDLVNPSLLTFGQDLTNLQGPMTQTQSNVIDLGNSAQKVVSPQLNNVANSANNASSSLNSLSFKIENWQMPVPSVQSYQIVPQGSQTSGTNTPLSLIPSRAVGGIVERDGVAMVHAGNVITPARVTKGVKGLSDLRSLLADGSQQIDFRLRDAKGSSNATGSEFFTLNYSPNVTVHGGNKNAKLEFQKMLSESSSQLEQKITKLLKRGRTRS